MKDELKKVTLNVDSGVYQEFGHILDGTGDVPSKRIRTLIARDVASYQQSGIVLNAILITHILDRTTDKNVDTLKFRKSFEETDLVESEKELIVRELEELVPVKSREYGFIKDMIDRSEFLNLPTRGAYKPVVLKTLAGLALSIERLAKEWIDGLQE